MNESQPLRRYACLRFSLRELICLTIAICAVLGWSVNVRQHRVGLSPFAENFCRLVEQHVKAAVTATYHEKENHFDWFDPPGGGCSRESGGDKLAHSRREIALKSKSGTLDVEDSLIHKLKDMLQDALEKQGCIVYQGGTSTQRAYNPGISNDIDYVKTRFLQPLGIVKSESYLSYSHGNARGFIKLAHITRPPSRNLLRKPGQS